MSFGKITHCIGLGDFFIGVSLFLAAADILLLGLVHESLVCLANGGPLGCIERTENSSGLVWWELHKDLFVEVIR